MVRMIIKRLLLIIPILFLVSLITFGLISLTPGDPAVTVAGETATPQQLALVRHQLGLDKPLVDQYVTFLGDASRLDFGNSIGTQQPVSDRIADTLPVTASLVLLTMVMAVLISVPAGVIAALYKQRLPDRLVAFGASFALAIPSFIIALALIVPFTLNRSWFPATGYVKLQDNAWEWFHHLVLPAFALSLVSASELTRQIRGALVDVMEQDFIRAGRAKGLPEWIVLTKHAFRNAAVPVVTVFGLQLARILGGAVIVESIFAIPGFGSAAVTAVIAHDYPMIRAIVLISAVVVVIVNLLVDVANGFINPKLRAA